MKDPTTPITRADVETLCAKFSQRAKYYHNRFHQFHEEMDARRAEALFEVEEIIRAALLEEA